MYVQMSICPWRSAIRQSMLDTQAVYEKRGGIFFLSSQAAAREHTAQQLAAAKAERAPESSA